MTDINFEEEFKDCIDTEEKAKERLDQTESKLYIRYGIPTGDRKKLIAKIEKADEDELVRDWNDAHSSYFEFIAPVFSKNKMFFFFDEDWIETYCASFLDMYYVTIFPSEKGWGFNISINDINYKKVLDVVNSFTMYRETYSSPQEAANSATDWFDEHARGILVSLEE